MRVSLSWFLGDCAVLQVDDRCKIFRLSLSGARSASLFRCVPYVRARFSLPRSYMYVYNMYIRVYTSVYSVRVCVRARAEEDGSALTKLAKYAPLGGARRRRRPHIRPSRTLSAYRCRHPSFDRPIATHRTAPRRRVSAAGKTVERTRG